MPLLYERVRDYLLDEIRSGRLSPGDRLPSEMELAAQFHVSRITSKRALEILRQDGLATRIRGKGTFVAAGSPVGDAAPSIPARPVISVVRADIPVVERAGRIGFIAPDISDVFGVRMLDAIEERCAEHGLQLVLRRTRGSQEVENSAITAFVRSGLDGLIVFPVHGEYYNDALLRVVLDGFPVVLVDRYLKGIAVSSVSTDNYAAARALTTALLDRGHREIAFLSPPPERTSSIEDRRRGFGAALRERGLPVIPDRYLMSLASTLPGTRFVDGLPDDVRRIRAFVDSHPEVTAYVVCEYILAVLLDRELSPGENAAPRPTVTCFDSPEDPFGENRFLHVRQDERAIGRAAVDILVDHIGRATPPVQRSIDFTLVEASATPS